MNKNKFFANESNLDFTKWLSRKLGKNEELIHSWTSRSNKTGIRAGMIWECSSIYDAYEKYLWPSIDPRSATKIETFSETDNILSALSEELKKSIKKRKNISLFQSIQNVLIWGGVERYKIIARDLRDPEMDRASYLESVMQVFKSESLSLDADFHIEVGGNRFEIAMDSGTTKIYSLICPKFIIYDSRVGSALGFLVQKWRAEKGIESIPESLRFSWGKAYGESNTDRRRNPNFPQENVFPEFQRITNKKRIENNICANWAITKALELLATSDSKDGFLELPDPLRAVEAALFMIGYEVANSSFFEKEKSHEKEESRIDISNDRPGEIVDSPIMTLGKGKKAKEFIYEGSVNSGVILKLSPDVVIDSNFMNQIITQFSGKRIPVGASRDMPTPGGLGEWIINNSHQYLNRNLSPQISSYLGAIFCHEGYATHCYEGNAVVLIFSDA